MRVLVILVTLVHEKRKSHHVIASICERKNIPTFSRKLAAPLFVGTTTSKNKRYFFLIAVFSGRFLYCDVFEKSNLYVGVLWCELEEVSKSSVTSR